MSSWRVGSAIPGVGVVASGHVFGASGRGVSAGGVAGEGTAWGGACWKTNPVPILIPVPVSISGIARMVRLPPSALRVGGALAAP